LCLCRSDDRVAAAFAASVYSLNSGNGAVAPRLQIGRDKRRSQAQNMLQPAGLVGACGLRLSLLVYGALALVGSLSDRGALGRNGSLEYSGALALRGSLDAVGALSLNG
jgi:hypothetical protein